MAWLGLALAALAIALPHRIGVQVPGERVVNTTEVGDGLRSEDRVSQAQGVALSGVPAPRSYAVVLGHLVRGSEGQGLPELREANSGMDDSRLSIHTLSRDGTPIPPAPEPTPTVVVQEQTVSPFIADVERYRWMVAQYDWAVDDALTVMQCESRGLNVQSYSGGPYFGLYQLWNGHFRPGEDWRDPATNIAVAYRVWVASGRSWYQWDWRCRP